MAKAEQTNSFGRRLSRDWKSRHIGATTISPSVFWLPSSTMMRRRLGPLLWWAVRV